MDFQINLDPAMLGGAGIVFLVGFSIVFIVLILLILILSIQAKIFESLSGKKPEKKAAPAPVPVPAPAPAPAPVATNVEDEDEIAAVIAAVLAMYDGGNGGLVVRSVRRVGTTTTNWANSGRQDYMATRY